MPSSHQSYCQTAANSSRRRLEIAPSSTSINNNADRQSITLTVSSETVVTTNCGTRGAAEGRVVRSTTCLDTGTSRHSAFCANSSFLCFGINTSLLNCTPQSADYANCPRCAPGRAATLLGASSSVLRAQRHLLPFQQHSPIVCVFCPSLAPKETLARP